MSVYENLFDWQKKIIEKHKDKESFGIWLDMGLGKTPLSLAFAEYHNCTKVLVISINNKAIETEEVKNSFPWWALKSNLNYNIINKKDLSEHKFDTNSNDLVMINYEYLYERNSKSKTIELRECLKKFINSCKGHNLCIIIDESHKMKDANSIQSRCINKIKKLAMLKCKQMFTYLLTGTPFTQGYIDLYSQLKFLGYESSKQDFKDAFCVLGNIPGLLGWQQPIVGYKNIDSLYRIIHRYAITIQTNEVEDLPDQIYINFGYKMTNSFKLFINEKLKGIEILKELDKRNSMLEEKFNTTNQVLNPFYRNIDYPQENYLADTPGNFWLRARQLSIGFQGNSDNSEWYDRTRLNMLEDFLKENQDNYILFYNYIPELYELFIICERLNYNVDVYCGELKSLYFYEKYEKQSKVEKFNNKKNIILANFASGSTGKNWQEYNKCIIFSTPLYKDYAQGIKRIHRLGQQKTVFYYSFFQYNFLDSNMKKALDENIDYNLEMFKSDLENNKNLLKS